MPSNVWMELLIQESIEVWEWINNSIPHFIIDVITYPCWEWNYSMLIKWPPGVLEQYHGCWYHGCWHHQGTFSISYSSKLRLCSAKHRAGPWFNIKMSSYQYRKSHCGDKTVVRSSYLDNGISYTGKMTSLYWFGPQVTSVTWPMIGWA